MGINSKRILKTVSRELADSRIQITFFIKSSLSQPKGILKFDEHQQ